MKKLNLISIIIVTLCLQACTTVTGLDGRQRQVVTPAGAAIMQGLIATGVGVGTGALMDGQPGWANGGVSSLAGSVSSQLVDAFLPKEDDQENYAPQQPPAPNYYRGSQNQNQNQNVSYQPQRQNYYQQDQAYLQQTEPIYRQMPNGQFAQIN